MLELVVPFLVQESTKIRINFFSWYFKKTNHDKDKEKMIRKSHKKYINHNIFVFSKRCTLNYDIIFFYGNEKVK